MVGAMVGAMFEEPAPSATSVWAKNRLTKLLQHCRGTTLGQFLEIISYGIHVSAVNSCSTVEKPSQPCFLHGKSG